MPIAPLNNCTAAAVLAAYRPLDYALLGQMVFSIVAVVIFFLVLYRTARTKRRIPYHANIKVRLSTRTGSKLSNNLTNSAIITAL